MTNQILLTNLRERSDEKIDMEAEYSNFETLIMILKYAKYDSLENSFGSIFRLHQILYT